MPRTPSYDPEKGCPICGLDYTNERHTCPKRILAAIDGANTRASNADLTEEQFPFPNREPSFHQKIKDAKTLVSDMDRRIPGEGWI